MAVTAIGLGLTAALGAAALVYSGAYDISATRQHWQATHSLLEIAMRQSVRRQARNIEEPALGDAQMAMRGAASFHDKCVQCHGAPGVAQADIGLSMQPLPGPLVDAKQHWRPRELYWVVRHGIKMTGMPAWQYRLTDDEIWDVVAFLRVLPALSAEDYRRDGAGLPPEAPRRTAQPAARVGDARAGRDALQQYLCVTCHAIPGVPGAWNYVGPALGQMGEQPYIAGVLPNTPENMARWLRSPGSFKPGTAMPDLGVSEQDAKDIAAFLRTLPDGP